MPLLALVLWLMDVGGALWWLWAWAAWVGFNLLLLVVYPTVIAPLFNKFEPLADPALAERVPDRTLRLSGLVAVLPMDQSSVATNSPSTRNKRKRLLREPWERKIRKVAFCSSKISA